MRAEPTLSVVRVRAAQLVNSDHGPECGTAVGPYVTSTPDACFLVHKGGGWARGSRSPVHPKGAAISGPIVQRPDSSWRLMHVFLTPGQRGCGLRRESLQCPAQCRPVLLIDPLVRSPVSRLPALCSFNFKKVSRSINIFSAMPQCHCVVRKEVRTSQIASLSQCDGQIRSSCACAHTHTHMQVHLHTCAHTNAQCMYVCTHMHAHVHTYTCTHKHMHICMRAHQQCTHVHIEHIYTCAHTRTCMHACIHAGGYRDAVPCRDLVVGS